MPRGNIVTVISGTTSKPKRMRRVPPKQQGFALLPILVILVVLVGVGACGWYIAHKQAATKTSTSPVAKDASTQALTQQQAAKALTIQGITVTKTDYYKLTTGSTAYYGHVQAIDGVYVRLAPVYYMGPSGSLTRLGNELQGPESIMYVTKSKISAIAKVAVEDQVLAAINAYEKDNPGLTVSDASPATKVNDYVKTNRYQMVVFDDGKAYFGKVHSLSGGDLFTADLSVFALQSSGATVSLATVDPAVVKALQSSQVQYWENLQSTSKVSRAITQYLQQTSSINTSHQ
jgi:hypothetical protein